MLPALLPIPPDGKEPAMKVKLTRDVPGVGNAQTVHSVPDEYGARMIGQGQAAAVKAETTKTTRKPKAARESKKEAAAQAGVTHEPA